MALLDDPHLRAVLGDAETLAAAARIGPALSGAEQITAPPQPATIEPTDELSGMGKAVGVVIAAAAAAIAPQGWSGGDLPLRALGGYSVVGTSDSVGVRLHELLKRGQSMHYLLVTDQRLAICAGELSGSGRSFTPAASVPRGDLVAARRRGRLGARGRLEFYFRDGSMVAVMAGMMSTSAADSIVAALALPGEPPGQ